MDAKDLGPFCFAGRQRKNKNSPSRGCFDICGADPESCLDAGSMHFVWFLDCWGSFLLRLDLCQEDKPESGSARSHAQGGQTGEAAYRTTPDAAVDFDINYETPRRIDGKKTNRSIKSSCRWSWSSVSSRVWCTNSSAEEQLGADEDE